MKILQQPVKVKKGTRIHVNFSRPANIYVMTDRNFKRYKEGASFRRMGGSFSNSPAEFTAPYDGVWHAVIELGKHKNPEPMTGSVETLPPLRKEKDYFAEPEPAAETHEEEAVVAEAQEEVEPEDDSEEEGEEEKS